ncbi:MAG: GDSL-type esterase/lipase family protein [Marinicellaceae bacterium]
MKRLVILSGLFISAIICAQTPKVLIVGDSWAAQQWSDNVHNAVFDVNGYPQFEAFGANVAISGSTAAEWVVPSELQKITDALNANPTIDTVQLTLGGNDFLDQWDTGMMPMQVTAIQNQITADLEIIVDHILAHDPKIEVIMSFYDYPNFVDSLGSFVPVCDNLFEELGEPTPFEINTQAVNFEQAFASIVDTNPRVFHVSHFGLMQQTFGFPDDNILPGDIDAPGDITLVSPVESMRITAGFIIDCFHLKAEGYDVLIQNLFESYYANRFDEIFKSSFDIFE